MKILLPFSKELNPYLDEIIPSSEHFYSYGSFEDYNPSFDFVNIHWPEALFEWREPSREELQFLKGILVYWKKFSTIVYTKHDFQRNKGTTPLLSELFKIIEKNTDIFIHLGKFSRDLYRRRYPSAVHEVVHHPLLKRTYKVFPREYARRQLGIDKEALVIIVPGKIRSFQERKLVLASFRALSCKKKVLISTNMRTELKFDPPGRVRLKKLVDIQEYFKAQFRKKHSPPDFIFTYDRISDEELSLKMSASDIVLVPRLEILNSGIIFLGLTFNKVIVGPAVGNIKEQLEELQFPSFNPNNMTSVSDALCRGVELLRRGIYPNELLEKNLPQNVAKNYDRIFSKYSKP